MNNLSNIFFQIRMKKNVKIKKKDKDRKQTLKTINGAYNFLSFQ